MWNRIVLAATLLGAFVLAGTAFAGNGAGPNKSSSSSISPPIVVSAAAFTSATSRPRYGDTITFNVSTSETANPYVDLKCYQNGALVGEGWGAFFDGGTPGTFSLYSGPWSGGAADCTADLGLFVKSDRWRTLASTSFHVDA